MFALRRDVIAELYHCAAVETIVALFVEVGVIVRVWRRWIGMLRQEFLGIGFDLFTALKLRCCCAGEGASRAAQEETLGM